MSMKLLPIAVAAALASFAGHSDAQQQDSSAGKSMDPETVRQVQTVLKEQGYDTGPVDGQWGRLTRIAVENFQLSNGIPATGQLNDRTLSALGVPQQSAAGASVSSSTGATAPR
jgi:peptidoglycan hydrolase-like protein with peptidoglycan-binding domain